MALASNNIDAPVNEDFADHLETYRTFVRWLFIFAAHVAVILTLLETTDGPVCSGGAVQARSRVAGTAGGAAGLLLINPVAAFNRPNDVDGLGAPASWLELEWLQYPITASSQRPHPTPQASEWSHANPRFHIG